MVSMRFQENVLVSLRDGPWVFEYRDGADDLSVNFRIAVPPGGIR